jgi:hypothetical protein
MAIASAVTMFDSNRGPCQRADDDARAARQSAGRAPSARARASSESPQTNSIAIERLVDLVEHVCRQGLERTSDGDVLGHRARTCSAAECFGHLEHRHLAAGKRPPER